MDEKETKTKADGQAAPQLDQRGELPPDLVEARKPLGKLISLRTRNWVRVRPLHGDLTSIVLPTTPEAISLALKGLLESVLAESGCVTLAEVLRETKLDLIVTADVVIPRTGELRLDAEKQLGGIIEELLRDDMAAESGAVQQYRYWTIPLTNFALALVPCDSDPVDLQSGQLVLETPLSAIQNRLEKAQIARQAIDAEREQWLRQQAEPLLDELQDALRDASLPTEFREQLVTMRERLRQDAYFPGIVETSDVAQQLGVDESWVREMARQGRLGLKLSRHFIHSLNELSHFDSKPREVGSPGKKAEN